jgi:hypothetical protein
MVASRECEKLQLHTSDRGNTKGNPRPSAATFREITNWKALLSCEKKRESEAATTFTCRKAKQVQAIIVHQRMHEASQQIGRRGNNTEQPFPHAETARGSMGARCSILIIAGSQTSCQS